MIIRWWFMTDEQLGNQSQNVWNRPYDHTGGSDHEIKSGE